MTTNIAYGKTGLEIALPDEADTTIIEPRHRPGASDQGGIVRDALRAPIASAPLVERANATDRVGIIFSDITRPTPYHIMIPALLEELSHIPDEKIIFFITNPLHAIFNTLIIIT